MARGRLLRSCLLALAAAVVAPQALADEPPIADVAAARKLFADAEKDEEGGKWLDAIAKFRRIVAFKETAGVRFHLALAEERVGQLVAARADYQRAFDLSRSLRDVDGRDVNERSGKSLEDLLKRTPIVTIVSATDAPGAVVSVDGAVDRAATERPFPHDPGNLLVEATAPGRTAFRRTEKLAEGARVTITVQLPPLSTESAPVGPVASEQTEAPPPPPPPPSRLPAYVLGGVGVAGIATGITFFVLHRRLDKANQELCGRTDVICDDRRESVANRHRTVAIVSGGVGVLSAAASVYFFTRGPSSVALSPTGVSYARTF